MHYYIDGYNLLFRTLHAGRDLQTQRQQIIEKLNGWAEQFNLVLTVVFDGKRHFDELRRGHYNRIEIVYTHEGQEADDYIVDTIRHADRPSQMLVVTDDRGLAWRARLAGAVTRPIADFMAAFEKRKPRTPPKSPKPPPPLPKQKSSHEQYTETFENMLKASGEETTLPLSDESIEPKRKWTPRPESEEGRWLEIFEERLRDLDTNNKNGNQRGD